MDIVKITGSRENKKYSAKPLIRAGFVLLLGITVYLAANILRVKSDHGINQQEGMYWQPRDTIDVVMMGTSHVHCDVNTGLLWGKYGKIGRAHV